MHLFEISIILLFCVIFSFAINGNVPTGVFKQINKVHGPRYYFVLTCRLAKYLKQPHIRGGGYLNSTQGYRLFLNSTHQYLKIDTRHAIEATHHTCLFIFDKRHPSDTKIDNVGYSFFPASETHFRVDSECFYSAAFPAGDYGGDLRIRRKSNCLIKIIKVFRVNLILHLVQQNCYSLVQIVQ